MNIISVDINKLVDSEYNPRIPLTPDDKEYQDIKNSIENFGYIQPIIINSDYKIISGHQRKNILLDLGKKKVDCVLVKLSKKKEKALNVAMNKVDGKWDDEKLFEILREIKTDEKDFILTGFDSSEFDDLFKRFDEEGYNYNKSGNGYNSNIEDDNYEPDENVKTSIKKGDLFQLGKHTLMCGDSTHENDVNKLLNNKVDLVLTDPPYGINIVGGGKPFGKVGESKIVEANNYNIIIGDETTETAEKFYNICNKINIENYILFGGNYFTNFLKPSSCWIIWDKQNTGDFADVEMAWSSFDKSAKLYKWKWNGMIREGKINQELKSRIHPTQKPVGLFSNILNDFTKENENILDAFGGSGSTLIACEQTNRKCFMIELDEKYCQVIIDRWEKFTGKEAKKIN